MAETMAPTFSAIKRPAATPDRTPTNPTIVPSTTKIDMMEAREAPSVRRIAMSDCFSFTVITNVETSPKAPTKTIRKRMIPIMRISTCTAANHVRFCRDQSVA